MYNEILKIIFFSMNNKLYWESVIYYTTSNGQYIVVWSSEKETKKHLQ